MKLNVIKQRSLWWTVSASIILAGIITVGIFSILGLLLPSVEIDSLFVVAILTIIGFSVNDTVVIYDRVREVIKEHPDMHIDQVVDDAVNQTLSRSINTTLTVLLTLFSIFLFGGETLKYFALCLFQYFYSQYAARLVERAR
jgi:preprotein translocase subunit SecF